MVDPVKLPRIRHFRWLQQVANSLPLCERPRTMTTPLVHIQDKIATITFNRPKSLNAITPEGIVLVVRRNRSLNRLVIV